MYVLDRLLGIDREGNQKVSIENTHPLNKFLVSRNCTGNRVVILRPPREFITCPDALLLAALLVRAGDPTEDTAKFKYVMNFVNAHHTEAMHV